MSQRQQTITVYINQLKICVNADSG